MQYSVSAIAAVVLAPLVVFSATLPGHARAQISMPSDAQIKAQMQREQKTALEALQRGGATVAAPGSFKTDIPVAPTPAGAKTDNLDDIVRKYQSGQEAKPLMRPGEHDLLVFVSFSMPKEILTELSRQAKEAGAVVVIRGFKDKTLSATKFAAQEVNKAGTEWDIHPELFKAFKVTKVPSFVVADASAASVLEDGCSPDASYASVSGNISIELALDTIRRRANPAIAQLAEARLKTIRDSSKAKALR